MQNRLFTPAAPVDMYSAHLPEELYSYLQSHHLLDGTEHQFKSGKGKIGYTISVKAEQILMSEADLNGIKETVENAIKTGVFSKQEVKEAGVPDSIVIEIHDHNKSTINSYAFVKGMVYRGLMIENNIPFTLDPASLIQHASSQFKTHDNLPRVVNNYLVNRVMSELKSIVLPEKKVEAAPTSRQGCALQ